MLMKSKDRVLRKNAWINFNKAYHNFESTLTQTLYYNYLKLNTYAKLHNFKDYISKTCFMDEIEVSFIENLYKQVAKFKPTYDEYLKKRRHYLKKQLDVKKIKPWDGAMELVKHPTKYTIEDAKKTVLDALSILGNEYCSHLKKAMDEKWISYMPKPGKHNGAYSIGGTKGLKKYYILMNFDETYDSVSTLAHELGHSMNSLYFCSKQKVYCNTTIFTAEIPSILNETLLALYAIEKNKDHKKLVRNFTSELLSNFFNTVTRQVIFSEFEWEANKIINSGKPFTKDVIKKLYENIRVKYCGKPNKKINKEPYSYSLSSIFRIGHFYAGNFYVYKYAVGQIAALCVANKIINKEPGILDKLKTFLESGTSKSPLETIKLLGIDMMSEEPYKEVLEFIKKIVAKF